MKKNYIMWSVMSAGLLAAAGIDLWRGHPLGAAADAAGAVVVPAAFWAMLRWAPEPKPVPAKAPVVVSPENRSYQEWRRAHRLASPDCRMCMDEDAVIAKACDEGVCCDPGDDQSV